MVRRRITRGTLRLLGVAPQGRPLKWRRPGQVLLDAPLITKARR